MFFLVGVFGFLVVYFFEIGDVFLGRFGEREKGMGWRVVGKIV